VELASTEFKSLYTSKLAEGSFSEDVIRGAHRVDLSDEDAVMLVVTNFSKEIRLVP
jgi:hypothetical protein